jgi:hypothetical protein
MGRAEGGREEAGREGGYIGRVSVEGVVVGLNGPEGPIRLCCEPKYRPTTKNYF